MTDQLHDKLTDINNEIQPDAHFADQLEAQLRTRHATRRQTVAVSSPTRYRVSSIAAGLVLMLVFVGLLPPVQTFAMTVLNGLFNRADTNEMTVTRDVQEATMVEVEPVIADIDDLTRIAGYAVQAPSYIPQGYTAIERAYFEHRETVTGYYQAPGRGLYITQQPLDRVEYGLLTDSDFGIGADAPVTIVTVGEYTGEYVEGAWIVEDHDIDDNTGTITQNIIWQEDVSMRTLRWIEDEMVYEIRAMGGSEGNRYIGLEEMIKIALGME